MDNLHYLLAMGIGFFAGGLFGTVFGFTRGRTNGHVEMFMEFCYRINAIANKGGTISELVDEVADMVPPDLDADRVEDPAERQ